jgi:hypothetical protein
MRRAGPGVVRVVNNRRLGVSGQVAMAVACAVGLVCAALGGVAGLLAVGWNGMTLLGARRTVGPKLGVLAFGVGAIYGLAALAGFSGTDPEDVDPTTSGRLAVVALGCVVVGVTSAVVWIADRRARFGDVVAGD